MLGFLVRGAARLARLPFATLAWAGKRVLLGRRMMLHVVVEPQPDALHAQRWLARLRRAAFDPGVRAVLLEVRGAPGGWATCADLRRVIRDLRTEGVAVTAWVEDPGTATLWIGAACDHLYVPPMVDISAVGVGTELTFARPLLDQLGLEVDVEAAGAYKSFGETFRRTYASPEAREATDALLAHLFGTWLCDLAAGRGLPVQVVADWVDRAPLSGEDALREGLVDGVSYLDVLLDTELERLDARKVPFLVWVVADALQHRPTPLGQIAVLHLEGPIVVDDPKAGTRIRSRAAVPLVRRLKDDASVKAVVLHVQSPGGSAYASDVLWREIARLAEAKPVVASFADVAASGGYYLATPAHAIVARSTSITGSVGVFGGKLVAQKAKRRLGLLSQRVGLRNATWFSPSAPFTAAQRERLRASLERTYDGFVARTAAGRGVEVDDIEPACRGRVWAGATAVAQGLVDGTGDLFDALAHAARLAELAPDTWMRHDVAPKAPSPLVGLLSGPFTFDPLAEAPPWVGLLRDHPGEALAVSLDVPVPYTHR